MAAKIGGDLVTATPVLCPANDQASDFDNFGVPAPVPITLATS
jgi:hypothetical protein